MDLIKIKLKALKTFCNSDLFNRFSIKPISRLRVESYLNNPRANTEDYCVYMFVENDDLIAFRTVLSDHIVAGGKKIPFGWCSGTYVKPEYRGKKLSVSLLNEAVKDWKNRLMFTNYAPPSEHCNLSIGSFKVLQQRTGLRFYFYPDFNLIYRDRANYRKVNRILPLLSAACCRMSDINRLIHFWKKPHYTETPFLDEECIKWLNNYPATFFNRKEAEIKWIIQYPWIMRADGNDFPYPFSFRKKSYKLLMCKIFDKKRFAGFFIYTLIESQMKIIYSFIGKTDWNLMATAARNIALKNRIAYLTILNPEIARFLKNKWGFLILSKHFTSNIYTSLDIENSGNQTIFDGDGDTCFT
jgi:GNAT superfamily N-acetyltransferase